jgi:hypothetical protein
LAAPIFLSWLLGIWKITLCSTGTDFGSQQLDEKFNGYISSTHWSSAPWVLSTLGYCRGGDSRPCCQLVQQGSGHWMCVNWVFATERKDPKEAPTMGLTSVSWHLLMGIALYSGGFHCFSLTGEFCFHSNFFFSCNNGVWMQGLPLA